MKEKKKSDQSFNSMQDSDFLCGVGTLNKYKKNNNSKNRHAPGKCI